jgi:phosphatidate cytidylyltransferase
MENKLKNIFSKNLLLRVFSLIVFIPLMILPIIFSNYLLFVVYIFFNSIILYEIQLMKIDGEKKKLLTTYKILITFVFFIFILIKITEKMSYFYIIELIIIIWLFDTFSFLGGKIIGGKKLMPLISAGKTQSGLLTGILATLFSFYIYSTTINEFSIKYLFFVSIILLFAFLGDVIASIVKRLSSIKDSGSIMPGHGGLLDRLDSFLGVFFFIGILELLL